MTDGFTWVHWKVLELAFDDTPLPDLTLEHEYLGFPAGSTRIPVSGDAETRQALRDLVALGAVAVYDDTKLSAQQPSR